MKNLCDLDGKNIKEASCIRLFAYDSGFLIAESTGLHIMEGGINAGGYIGAL